MEEPGGRSSIRPDQSLAGQVAPQEERAQRPEVGASAARPQSNAAEQQHSQSVSGARPALWWIGPTTPVELAKAYSDVCNWESQRPGTVRTFTTAAEAIAALVADPAPELMLLAVNRPGELTHAEVAMLQQQAPLARQVALLGSLCEGEQRTGRPWPGVGRYYWHQWPWRLKPELAQWLRQRDDTATEEARPPFPWELPLTATEDERCLSVVSRAGAGQVRDGLIAVAGTDAAMVQTLVGLCRRVGWNAAAWTMPQPPAAEKADEGRGWYPGVAAGVWDVFGPLEANLPQLADFAARLSPAPVVAVLNFPRWNEVLALRQAGVAAVVSKPLYQGDLAAALAACTGDREACQV